MKVSVPCVCGRVYTVPASRAGKRLQCRRCGAISRVPEPIAGEEEELAVAFQAGPAAVGWELDLEVPVRRCPSCGTSDDASIVVCVRCGYDWRAGERLDDAHEASDKSARRRQVSGAESELATLQGLIPWALTPLGVALGPYLVLRSFAVEGALARSREVAATLGRVRLAATVGGGLWLIALALGVSAWRGRPTPSPAALAATCRARLERIALAIESERRRDGAFPADPAIRFPVAIRNLAEAERGGLRPSDLRCPLGDGLYPYALRSGLILDDQVRGDYVIAWDRATHGAAGEPVRVHALRADGAIEALVGNKALDAALARPARGAGQGSAGRGEPVAGQPGADGVAPWEDAVKKFLGLAAELASLGPTVAMSVSAERFEERVGLDPAAFFARALADGDPELRRAAAEVLGRCEVPGHRRRGLLARLREADDDELAWLAVAAERRWGEPDWRIHLLELAQAEEPGVQARARDVLARDVEEGPDAAKALLEAAAGAGRVALLGLQLSPAGLANVASYLGRGRLGTLAEELLALNGRPGADAAAAALARSDAAARQSAFRALDALRREGAVDASRYLEWVGAERTVGVQVAALSALTAGPDALPPEAIGWVLQTLRAEPPPALRAPCARLLADVGRGRGPEATAALAVLVGDLEQPGDPEAVLAELAAPARRTDDRIDAALVERWSTLQVEARRALPDILARRLTPGSVTALRTALEDGDDEVVAEAAEALGKAQAPIGDVARRELAEALARTIARGGGGTARRATLRLARRPWVCAQTGEEDDPTHRCTPELQRALRDAAQAGERGAVRALAAHKNMKVLDILAGLLDSRFEAVRNAAGDALVELTGVRRYYRTASDARQALAPYATDLAGRLRAHGKRERGEIKERRAQADRRLAEALR